MLNETIHNARRDSVYQTHHRKYISGNHAHKNHQLVVNFSDIMNIQVDEHHLSVLPMQAAWIPGGAQHNVQNASELFILNNIYFYPRSHENEIYKRPHVFSLPISVYRELQIMFLEDSPYDPNHIYEQLPEWFNMYGTFIQTTDTKHPEISRMLKFIRDNITTVSPAQLLDIGGFDDNGKLRYAFKQIVGMSPSDYIKNQRIQAAVDLLRQGKTGKETANDLRIPPSQLTREFIEIVGLNPSQYQKQIKTPASIHFTGKNNVPIDQ